MENNFDVLTKIQQLKNERGWSVYKLSYEAGLTQSTIANMFSRKTQPSISTLSLICDAFGITLAEFFGCNNNNLTTDELLLIANYKKLSAKNKNVINSVLQTLLKSE